MNEYFAKMPIMPPPADMPPPPPPTDTTWIRRQFCDIPYGEEEVQKFNVYLPNEGEGPFPTVVFFHGGAFIGGDRTDPQLRPYLELVKYGLALVSVDYRLATEVVFPEGIRDCNAALKFIIDNAAEWQLDPARVGLLGDSSGANFALTMTAANGNPFFYHGEPTPADIKCCVTWFCPTDFLAVDKAFLADGAAGTPGMIEAANHNGPWSPESLYLGGHMTELDPEYVRKADPAAWVTPELPPVFMQHGRNDHVVHYTQSLLFRDRANAVCGDERVTAEIIPGADHADPKIEAPENVAKVAAFFLKHLA